MNNNTLPTMPMGQAATLRRMPSRALAKPKPLPMISRHRMTLGPIVDLGVQQPQEYFLEIH